MVETRKIPFNLVRIPEVRASSRMTPDQAAFFKSTVDQFGVIQDPIVRPLQDGTYELVAGRSRVLEMAEKGALDMDMKVIEASEETALFMHLAENVARGEVDPVSVARVIDKLMAMEVSVADIAKKLGRSETWVRRTHQLLELPEVFMAAVADGRLTPTHIQEALSLPTPYEVAEALQTAIRLGWNTSTLHVYVGNRLEQLKRAHEEATRTGAPVQAPTPEPEKMVQFRQCLICGYQVPLEKVVPALVCEGCRDLVKYIVDQTGAPPAEAIDTVYKALVALYQAPPRTGPEPLRTPEPARP